MALLAYTRVSTTRQADVGESLEVQARQLTGWAMMSGLSIDEFYVEAGVSGCIPIRERKAGGKLWDALKSGDTVVAAKLDRMFRSSLDALQSISALKERGVSLVLLDLGTDSVTNGMAKLVLTILAAVAEAERDRIRERVSVSKADAKAQGKYLGGKVPFGFSVNVEGMLEPVEAEQAALATMHLLKASGASLRAISAEVASTAGRRLSPNTIARILGTPSPFPRP